VVQTPVCHEAIRCMMIRIDETQYTEDASYCKVTKRWHSRSILKTLLRTAILRAHLVDCVQGFQAAFISSTLAINKLSTLSKSPSLSCPSSPRVFLESLSYGPIVMTADP